MLGDNMNNKGFMLAEVVVVSAVILTALSVFYINYNKIISLYNERINYYDPTTLYELAKYRDDHFTDSSFALDTKNKKLYDSNGKIIYLFNGSYLDNLQNNVSNKTFKNYIEFLKTNIRYKYNRIFLTMENCDSNKMNCKYAYLEVLVRP